MFSILIITIFKCSLIFFATIKNIIHLIDFNKTVMTFSILPIIKY